MLVQPYVNFNGRCDEAIAFYKKALGAEVGRLMRFKECPDGKIDPATADKVMHCSVRIGETVLFASDGRCQGSTTFSGIVLSLGVKSDAEAERCFAALAEGGQAHMPLGPTFFASKFGMLADKLGVNWMIINPLEQ